MPPVILIWRWKDWCSLRAKVWWFFWCWRQWGLQVPGEWFFRLRLRQIFFRGTFFSWPLQMWCGFWICHFWFFCNVKFFWEWKTRLHLIFPSYTEQSKFGDLRLRGTRLSFIFFDGVSFCTFRWFPFQTFLRLSSRWHLTRSVSFCHKVVQTLSFLRGIRVRRLNRSRLISHCLRRLRLRTSSLFLHVSGLIRLRLRSSGVFFYVFCPFFIFFIFWWVFLISRDPLRCSLSWTLQQILARKVTCLRPHCHCRSSWLVLI